MNRTGWTYDYADGQFQFPCRLNDVMRGSYINYGDCGAASALCIQFLNVRGESFIPAGGMLTEIVAIYVSLLVSA